MCKILLSMKKAVIYLVALLLALFPLAALTPSGNIYAAEGEEGEVSATQPDPRTAQVSINLGETQAAAALREAVEAAAQSRSTDTAVTTKPEAEESYLAYDQLTVPEIEEARIDAENTLLAKRESMDREWLEAKQAQIEEARQKAAAAEASENAEKKSSASSGGSSASTGASSGVSEGADLGKFKLTAYCPCYQCSQGWGRKTSSGRTAQANHTIAVDPSVIPEGTHVIINGQEYVAEDVGGGVVGNHIDIFYESHSDALNFGVRYAEVYAAN